MDEHEVEARLRADLERRAAEADVTAPVVARARERVARRRRTRLSVGAVAAAVVVVVGGVAVATRDGGGGTSQPADDGPTPSESLPGPGEWRTEYWADTAVDVPADWGYGGAPDRSGTACYPIAMVSAAGERLEERADSTVGWVGRPIGITDVCATYPWIEHSPQETPTAPYVWLGAGVDPGVVEYADGFVQETVEVNGSTVTVGTTDDALRERILSTARGGEMCLSERERIPGGRSGWTFEGRGDVTIARICAYRASPEGGHYLLSYAADVDSREAEDAVLAAEASERAFETCDDEPFEFVVLEAERLDPMGGTIQQRAVYEMGCDGTVDVGEGPNGQPALREMTPDSVAPWAVGGIPAVVVGPTGGKGAMIDYFIGPRG